MNAGAGETRFIHFHIVIGEWVAEPLHDAAGAVFDRELAGSVKATLAYNGGFDVDTCEVLPQSVSDENWTMGWPMWARQLDALLAEVAVAQRAATVAYAEAFMAAEGTQQFRAASAELAAAAAVETHATLAGRAEAFRMVLATQTRTDPHSAPVVAP